MDDAACSKNLTGCLASQGLKLCDADKDICLQHGLCITSIVPSPISVCVCYPCYYGDTCEKEMVSRNLWSLGQPMLQPEMVTAFDFFLLFFSIVQLINCLLCLQTYFSSQKIRITNVGVYLIFNSIVSLLIAIEELIASVLLRFIERLPDRYFEVRCLVDQKFVLLTLAAISDWSIVFIALERMLVECYHYNLFDSRRRSFIISALIFIICPLTTIPGIFTVKTFPANELNPQVNKLMLPFSCVNYTPLGYTIFKVISVIHSYGTLLSYIVLCLFVFVHLLRHRQRIVPDHRTLQNIRLVLRNHRDFFIPLGIPILFSTPIIILNEIMTCSKASELESLPYLLLVFGCIFALSTKSFTFFYYIVPANVYIVAFWKKSPVGRLLSALKRLLIRIKQHCTNFRNTHFQTRTGRN